nr:hypothetical protein [Mangrovicoccus ximenensis]
MTEEGTALLELLEQRADGGLVRAMLAYAVERIMEFGRDEIGPEDRSWRE